MPQLSTNQIAPSNSDDLDAVVEAAVARAYHWMETTAEADADDASTQQLAQRAVKRSRVWAADSGRSSTEETTTSSGATSSTTSQRWATEKSRMRAIMARLP